MAGLTMTTKYNGRPVGIDDAIKELGALPNHVQAGLKRVRSRMPAIAFKELIGKLAELYGVNGAVIRSSRRVYTRFSNSDPDKFRVWLGLQPIRLSRRRVLEIESDTVRQWLDSHFTPKYSELYAKLFTDGMRDAIRKGR